MSAYGVSEYHGQPLTLHFRSLTISPSVTLLDAFLTLDTCPGCDYHTRRLYGLVTLSDTYVRLTDLLFRVLGRVTGVWAEVGRAAFPCQLSLSELSETAFYWCYRVSSDAAVRR